MGEMEKLSTTEFDEFASEFDDRTGEELYEEFLGKQERSKNEFVYYYAAILDIVTSLTGSAHNLLAWLTFNCDVNSGRVVVQSHTLKDALKETGMTLQTYYKSLNILRELDVIRGGNAVYYVNPTYAWKGTADLRNKFMKVYPKL